MTNIYCKSFTDNTPTLLRMSSTSFRKISSTLKLSLALASQKRIPLIREENCDTNSEIKKNHRIGAEIKLNNTE